ncbi:PREDICTED: uncharacterized protein LOC105513870 [Colobus angolensis palliatus]|uniref:uncharacterized protein LOC105513870 n=1 Tax=Colobus angolensis palliatus TaxID=336983 RepID=UPI0005F3AD39|nr:PREDICTED: uncharacterized protein LOC105513870 [Colobus angolensis palliatus]
MRVPRHPGGFHRSAVGLLCEKGPAGASLVQIRCQTVFLRIHPNRSLISPCGSPGPPSRPEPKCLGSWEKPAPFFSSLATSSHFRLLTVPKQATKTLRELGPGPEAENRRKKRSGRAPLLMPLGASYCQRQEGRGEERKSSLHALLGPILVLCVVEGGRIWGLSRSLLLQLLLSSPKSCS